MSQTNWLIRANLKLRHLQLLVALDEQRNIGKVANTLSITQPAVSKMLAALEDSLGTRLFERGPHGMAPTEHGASFIGHARQILLQLTTAQEDLRNLSEGQIQRISLGVLPAAALVLVPRFIVALEARASDVAITVREGTSDYLLPALRSGELNLVVGVLPGRQLPPDLQVEQLYSDPFVMVVGKDHRLARRKRVDWSDLRDYPMVMPPSGALTHDMILDMLARHQLQAPRRYVQSLSTLTNLGVLSESDSYTMMPLEIARYFKNWGAVAILPLTVPELRRNVGLMWQTRRQGKSIEPLLQLFRETRDAVLREASAADYQEGHKG